MTLATPAQRALGVAPAQVMLPFEFGARLRQEKLVNTAGSSTPDFALDGETVEFPLPRAGYGYGILVEVSGNMVVSTATLVPKGGGIYNYLRRAIVDFPGGGSAIVRISGRALKGLNLLQRAILTNRPVGLEPAAPNALLTNPTHDTINEDAADLTIGTRAWRLHYWIPFARNIRDLRGLRPLGHGGQRTRLQLQPSTEADFVTVVANADSSAINVEATLYYFDAPPPGVARPEDHGYTRWLTHLEEERHDVTAVGERELEVDPEGIILAMISDVWLNDAPNSADLGAISLDLDRRTAIKEIHYDEYIWTESQKAGIQWPTGMVPFVFDQHQHDPEPIDGATRGARGREWLYSDEYEEVTPKVTIDSGATLGTVARIVTAVQRLVPAR